MIVDDHGETLAGFLRVLGRAGVRTRVFTGASAARASIDACAPDVVITELGLRGATGAELAAQLRASPSTADVPLVAMSALLDQRIEVVRLFDAFLFKPVDPRLVVPLVETLAAERRRRVRRVAPEDAAPRRSSGEAS